MFFRKMKMGIVPKTEGLKLCKLPKVGRKAVFLVFCIDFSKGVCYIKGGDENRLR